MANNNKDNVKVPKVKATGVVFIAPIGTAIPTDVTTTLDEAFKNVGYISEDGITNSIETDTEDIKEMGGDTVAVEQTSRKETFSMTFIETNEESLKVYYGDKNVSKAGDTFAIKHNGSDDTSHSFVIEVVYKGNIVERTVVPSGKVTEVGEKSYKTGNPVGFEVTISASPDAAGNTAYTYIGKVL